jgi:hypothetical protein
LPAKPGNSRLSAISSQKIGGELPANLTNKYYFYSKFDLSSLAGTITGSPAPPLAWALTVKKTF